MVVRKAGHSHHHRCISWKMLMLAVNLRFSSTLTKFNGIAVQGEAERPGRGKGKEKGFNLDLKKPTVAIFLLIIPLPPSDWCQEFISWCPFY